MIPEISLLCINIFAFTFNNLSCAARVVEGLKEA